MTTKAKQAETQHRMEIQAAVTDELQRMNRAVKNGVIVKVHTFNGDYTLLWVDADWQYHTDGNGGFGQTWMGCNDGGWVSMMRQAGLPRNPLFEKYS